MKSNFLYPPLLLLTSLLLSGCGGVALHNDEVNYSNAGANDANEQLLNNLARYSCYDPPYFLQLGQINALHTYQGSAGLAQDAQSHNHYGATAGLMTTEQPSFSFVPIAGTNIMNAISAPISSKLFLTFYRQGYSADVLARVLFQSVIFVNKKNGKTLTYAARNDPADPTYPDFLRYCIGLRSEQMADINWVWNGPSKAVVSLSDAKVADVVAGLAADYEVKDAQQLFPPPPKNTGESSQSEPSPLPINKENSVQLNKPGEMMLYTTGDTSIYPLTDEQQKIKNELPSLSAAALKALGISKNTTGADTISRYSFDDNHEDANTGVQAIM